MGQRNGLDRSSTIRSIVTISVHFKKVPIPFHSPLLFFPVNALGDEGAQLLAQAVAAHPSLIRLSLGSVPLPNSGGEGRAMYSLLFSIPPFLVFFTCIR